MTEHDFQCNIVSALQKMNIFVFAVPNSQKLLQTKNQFLRMKFLTKQKSEGFMSGVSDLIILNHGGKAYFAEIKALDKPSPQSPTQKEFQRNVEALGFKYFLIKSWADFNKMLEEIK